MLLRQKLWIMTLSGFAFFSCSVQELSDRSEDQNSQSVDGAFLDQPLIQDDTVSHEQPPSDGFLGGEGKCGQTALANFCCMVNNCLEYHPDSPAIVDLCKDITPGVHPNTLCAAAGELCEGIPDKPKTADSLNPIDLIKNCLPAMVLVNWGGEVTSMHWVTIVKIENGRVYFNHWGRQDNLPIDEFVTIWGFTNCDLNEQNLIIKGMKCNQFSFICSEPKTCEEGLK